jgi:iron complex outermembrane receptor protein
MRSVVTHLSRGASLFALVTAGLATPALAEDGGGSVSGAPIEAVDAQEGGGSAVREQSDETIIVTGSRVGRTSFDSPTPVNVVGADRLRDLAIANVADALNQLPAFRASTTPTANLFRVSGAIGANSVDLRGLGTTRTLTLLDGRRFVPSTDGGAIDLNGIPSALVQRSEVVTGGASAAYGADAIAGVVNLILDRRLNGVRIDISGGISSRSDYENIAASIAGGTDFASGRGHVVAGVEFQKNYGIGPCEARAFCLRGINYVGNPGYINGVSTNGLPATLVLDDVRFVLNPTGILVSAVQTVGGVKTTLGQQLNSANQLPNALRNLQFSADGRSLVPFQFGNFLSGQFMQGGDPSTRTPYGFNGAPLATPTWHLSAMAHVDYQPTDDLNLSAEFIYSHVNGGPAAASVNTHTPIGGSVGISIDNPFLSPEVRAQILATNPNITAINVYVARPETGPQLVGVSDNDIYRGMLALDGGLFGGWRWEAYYTHGETRSRTEVSVVRLTTFDNDAPNAITPPPGYTGPIYTTPSGAPVICASSVANPSNGCVPVNLIGANALTPDIIARYFLDEWQTRTIKQDAVALNLNGPLFDLGAGPAQAAVGVEWRHDSAEGDTDPLTLANAFSSPQVNALPRVSREVIEGYVEASVPLLRDLPFAHSLTVDGALRQTHYNTIGNATTWKLGAVYEPTASVMFRVTRSHDIRAPTAAESNPNTITLVSPILDPFLGSTHFVEIVSGGNPNLRLEQAETFTVGGVVQPAFVPRLRLSLDYYKIDVDGAIDTLSAPNILNACFSQNLLCNLITFSGTPRQSPASAVYSNFQNLSTLQARGFEFVGQYRIPDVAGGAIDIALNANYVSRLVSIGATGLVTRFHGVTGNPGALGNVLGVPRYKIDAVVTYSRPAWSVTAHGRYIPSAILDPTKVGPGQPGYDVNAPNSVNINTVSSRFYLDLAATIRPGILGFSADGLEIYGSINNLFDTVPPRQLRLFGNPLHYDVVGRAFRLGVRARF